jgi:hypothetical protein
MNMKTVSIVLAGMLFASCAGYRAGGDRYNAREGKVILTLKDGTVAEGWNVTAMRPKMRYVKLSDHPKGKTTVRYASSQIERLTFVPSEAEGVLTPADTVSFVCKNVRKGKKTRGLWLRREYAGDRVTVYSCFEESFYWTGDFIRPEYKRFYYGQLDGGDPVAIGAVDYEGGLMKRYTRRCLSGFFKDYPGFVNRIQSKAFDGVRSPVETVKAWEEAYGATNTGR